MSIKIGTRVSAIEGTEVTIICPVNAFPRPRVVWLQDSEQIDEQYEAQGFFITPFNGSSSTLVIKGKQGARDSALYGCSARNIGGTVASYSRVTYHGECCMYVRMYVCMYVSMCVYVCMYVCM